MFSLCFAVVGIAVFIQTSTAKPCVRQHVCHCLAAAVLPQPLCGHAFSFGWFANGCLHHEPQHELVQTGKTSSLARSGASTMLAFWGYDLGRHNYRCNTQAFRYTVPNTKVRQQTPKAGV